MIKDFKIIYFSFLLFFLFIINVTTMDTKNCSKEANIESSSKKIHLLAVLKDDAKNFFNKIFMFNNQNNITRIYLNRLCFINDKNNINKNLESIKKEKISEIKIFSIDKINSFENFNKILEPIKEKKQYYISCVIEFLGILDLNDMFSDQKSLVELKIIFNNQNAYFKYNNSSSFEIIQLDDLFKSLCSGCTSLEKVVISKFFLDYKSESLKKKLNSSYFYDSFNLYNKFKLGEKKYDISVNDNKNIILKKEEENKNNKTICYARYYEVNYLNKTRAKQCKYSGLKDFFIKKNFVVLGGGSDDDKDFLCDILLGSNVSYSLSNIERFNIKNMAYCQRFIYGFYFYYYTNVLIRKKNSLYKAIKGFEYPLMLGDKRLLIIIQEYMQQKYNDQDFSICIPESYIYDGVSNTFKEIINKHFINDDFCLLKKSSHNACTGNKVFNVKCKNDFKSYSNIVSEYNIVCKIIKPHLLFKKKYSLGIYTLVTSFEPLTVYMYNDGIVLFCTEDYDKNKIVNEVNKYMFDKNKIVNEVNKYMFFSNKCVNINNIGKYKENKDILRCEPSIATFTSYLKYMKEELKFDTEKLLIDIKDVIIKTLIGFTEKYSVFFRNFKFKSNKNFFGLFRYDFMLDENKKLFLLEINQGPDIDFGTSHIDDYINENLLLETFNILGTVSYRSLIKENDSRVIQLKLLYKSNNKVFTEDENLNECIAEYNRYKSHKMQEEKFELLIPFEKGTKQHENLIENCKYIKNHSNLTERLWKFIKENS